MNFDAPDREKCSIYSKSDILVPDIFEVCCIFDYFREDFLSHLHGTQTNTNVSFAIGVRARPPTENVAACIVHNNSKIT